MTEKFVREYKEAVGSYSTQLENRPGRTADEAIARGAFMGKRRVMFEDGTWASIIAGKVVKVEDGKVFKESKGAVVIVTVQMPEGQVRLGMTINSSRLKVFKFEFARQGYPRGPHLIIDGQAQSPYAILEGDWFVFDLNDDEYNRALNGEPFLLNGWGITGEPNQ